MKSSAADVRAAVAKLPETLRAAVVLRYFAELDVAQVAEALGISKGAAKVRLFAARRRLAQILSLTDAGKGASNGKDGGDGQI